MTGQPTRRTPMHSGLPPELAASGPSSTAVVPSPDTTEVDRSGLDDAAVAERRAAGLVNRVTDTNRRTYGDIIRANIFTRFNAILGTLLAVVVVIGAYRDALFGIVLVSNALIGIVQEIRAKRTLDRLSLISAPKVTVTRSGEPTDIRVQDVVLDDLVEVRPGDQVPVDGDVIDATGLEVDESLLTGEAEPMPKQRGDGVLSGSFVVAGRGLFRATAVGDEAYAARLAAEAKRFAVVNSELRGGTDRILRVVMWLMIPTGVLLLWTQLRGETSTFDALRATVAGTGAIIPEGLVLLTSLAFAVGVIRLGRRQALVQELPAVELLARVDVVCLDKTGTLTQGHLVLASVVPVGDTVRAWDGEGDLDERLTAVLGALGAAEERPNASLAAIAEHGEDPGWTVSATVPFSSARKWSAASFDGEGNWLLGAADVLLAAEDPTRARAEELAATGQRILLLARSGSVPSADRSPDDVEAVALLGLEEQLRPEAPATLEFFHEQGVAVKVISGDHPTTVGAVAKRVGVPEAGEPVDARELPDDPDELADLLEQRAVFGRVQPHQKRAMVQALQRRGHTVAMTGDGVNDVLALKDADIGVAMGSGSGASRSVAQLVLLDDSFASLPEVVGEGRKVIANIERVANLFVTKSVYAFLLSMSVAIAALPFPFFPRHLTIISSLTIGIPAFFLALAPNARRARPGFVGRVARFAIPAGAIAAAATFLGFALARNEADLSLVEERTTAVIVLFLVASWVLMILARPLTEPRVALLATLYAAFVVALATPGIREFFELEIPPLVVTMASVGVAAVAVGVMELLWQVFGWAQRRGFAPADTD